MFEKQRSQTLFGVRIVRNHLNEACCFSLLMLLSMKNRKKICGPMRVNRFWCGKRYSVTFFLLFHISLKAPARLGLSHSPLTQKCSNFSQVSQLLISSFLSDFFHQMLKYLCLCTQIMFPNVILMYIKDSYIISTIGKAKQEKKISPIWLSSVTTSVNPLRLTTVWQWYSC